MKDEEHENVKGNSPSSGGVESKRTGRRKMFFNVRILIFASEDDKTSPARYEEMSM